MVTNEEEEISVADIDVTWNPWPTINQVSCVSLGMPFLAYDMSLDQVDWF